MLNKRKHLRQITQQKVKSDILRGETDNIQKFKFKPTITNISFGGMGLIFVPAVDNYNLNLLQSGKSNLFVEFNLPPSAKMLSATGRVKWSKQKTYLDTPYTIIGMEFLHKTPELYREIDKFLKSPSPYSELFKNKRTFPRIDSEIQAEFSIPGIKKFRIFPQYFSGNIFNISAIGAMLMIKPRLNEREISILKNNSSPIILKFNLPGISRHLAVESRPVHLRNITQSGKLVTTMGVKFINLTDSLLTKLVEYVSVKKVAFLKQDIEDMQVKS